MDTSDYIALFALIVSVCAVTLTFYEGYQSRAHQRLSVKPKLNIDVHTYGEKGEFAIEVENKGLGPAFVTKFNVFIDDERINSTPHKLWKDCLKLLGIPDFQYEMYIPTTRSMLSPGSSHFLWRLYIDPKKINVEEMMARIKITIDYESIYREPDSVTLDGRVRDEAL